MVPIGTEIVHTTPAEEGNWTANPPISVEEVVVGAVESPARSGRSDQRQTQQERDQATNQRCLHQSCYRSQCGAAPVYDRVG